MITIKDNKRREASFFKNQKYAANTEWVKKSETEDWLFIHPKGKPTELFMVGDAWCAKLAEQGADFVTDKNGSFEVDESKIKFGFSKKKRIHV